MQIQEEKMRDTEAILGRSKQGELIEQNKIQTHGHVPHGKE